MVVDFCIPGRNQPLMEAFADWDKRAKDAVSDYSYHMCITYWDDRVREDMAKVVEAGVTTFKHFMAYKGALMVNDEEMFASFSRCAELGAMPLVHAENGEVVAALQKHYLAKGITGPEGHALSRPPDVEGEAANRAIMLADQAGVPLYIVHTSCIQAHEAIARARALGKRVYGEPLIQHLVLDESEYYNKDWKHAARRVMSPPFRDKIHQDDLWNGLRAGSLQVVATDHCAFTTKQKELGLGDFTKIPNGTGGLEDRMPVLWTYGVETGRLTPNEFVAVTSTNIARILNLYPRKGAILPGADADITVWDPKANKTISARTQVSVIDYNVFEGTKVTGLPRYTLSRGEVVFRDGGCRRSSGAAASSSASRSPPTRARSSGTKSSPRWRASRARGTDSGWMSRRLQAVKPDVGGKAPAADAAIEISGVSLRFDTADGPVQALSNVDLRVARGEFVSFIGPSGCGKTTLLRAVADLETPDQRRNPRQRHEPARSAREARLRLRVPGAGALSVAHRRAQYRAAARDHGLRARREREARVAKGLELVNLSGFGAKFPWQLSGGMQQRASIARALSFDPDLLLMDEPFGALDEIVRDMLNQQLLRLWDVTGKTVLFVTHSIPEAVFLSTHIVVMSPRPGRIYRRHRMQLSPRPHARNPRDARIPGRSPTASGAA